MLLKILIYLLIFILLFATTCVHSDINASNALEKNLDSKSKCQLGFSKFQEYNVTLHSLYCLTIDRQASVPVKTIGFGGDSNYQGAIHQFVNNVTMHLKQSGIVYAIAEDSSSVPQGLAEYLQSIKQPLLSHAQPLPADSVIIMPDFHFIQTLGFQTVLKELQQRNKYLWRTFEVLRPRLFWRGSTSGFGDDCYLLPRVQLCEKAISCTFCDIKISALVQACNATTRNTLNAKGVLGKRAKEYNWPSNKVLEDLNILSFFGLLVSFEFMFCNRTIYARVFWTSMVMSMHGESCGNLQCTQR